jgi:hypothetical protein
LFGIPIDLIGNVIKEQIIADQKLCEGPCDLRDQSDLVKRMENFKKERNLRIDTSGDL